MAATGHKGVDVRESANRLVFDAFLLDSTGTIVTSGTTSLYLYEVQDDGTLKSYDFNDNTFKATALTTETVSMTHRQGNNATTNTGLWTHVLATLTGFTVGAVYYARVVNSNASPTSQITKFQFGGVEGDGIANPLADDDARIDLLALEATSQTILSDVGDIPINPLLDSDGRLNNLDAAVSTRATPTNVTDAQTAIIAQVDANETKIDTLLARIGAWTGSGVNTLLGAFRALLSKTATAPSDIGGTFDPAADSTEAIRDRGDAAWATATGFSTLTSGDVQTAATNALNAYDPPTKAEMDAAFTLLNDLDSAAVAAAALSALASYDPPTKAEMDSGFATLNDLDAAGVRAALGMASANLDTQLATLPTAAEIIDAYKAIGVDDLDMMETIRVLLWCAIGNTTGLNNGYGTFILKKRDGATTAITASIDQHGNRTITIVDLS